MNFRIHTSHLLSGNLKLSFFLFLNFVLHLTACPLWGQVVQKKELTVSDYQKWGQLALDKVSRDGQWVSYSLKYENKSDTLFVKNIASEQTYSFPSATSSDFIDKNWLLYRNSQVLHLFNLKTGQGETLSEASQYAYSAKTKQLILLYTCKGKASELVVREPEGTIRERIYGVTEFLADPSLEEIAYITRADEASTVSILNLSKNGAIKKIAGSEGVFTGMLWQGKEKKALAFYGKTSDGIHDKNVIFLYSLSTGRLYSTKTVQNNFFGDSLSVIGSSHSLKISADLKRIFFMVQKKNWQSTLGTSDPQLWYGNAPRIYPQQEKLKLLDGMYLAQWQPEENSSELISNDTLTQFMLTGRHQHAVLFNTAKYEPQYGRDELSDFYIRDLSTGKMTQFLTKNTTHVLIVIPSPDGKYITYFRDRHWWVYNIEKNAHVCVTKKAKTPFFQNSKQHPSNEEPYHQFGWTLGDKELLLYDEWDLWAFMPDGSSSRRLTNGKESDIHFRHPAYSRIIRGATNYNGWMLEPVNLNNGLLLEKVTDYGTQSCFRWTAHENKNLATTEDSSWDQLTQSADGSTLVYREQRYDLPPRLVAINEKGIKKILVQSNPQQQLFHWGKAELISYRNKAGKILKGVLYYPAQYDAGKKYPMIVYIYEKLSNRLHSYINPSQYTGDGLFNITTFATQGYFVLAPDISYETGDPGISAADCVISAATEIVNKGFIQPDKIGIVGHSFGGYECNFIITQTNLFSAAVAGSAVSDLTSAYLSIGKALGKPDIWRFESQQFRMGRTLFSDRAGYKRNSPIEYAENITTPLFSWTGSNDVEVNPEQSIEFYLALHRLKKQQIMAVYPNEGHNLDKSKNKRDLSIRLHQWFDYFLKDASAAEWIKEGLN